MGGDRGKRKSLSAVDKLFDLLFVSIVLRKSNAKEKKVSTSFQCTHITGLLFIHFYQFFNFAYNSHLRLIRFVFSLNVPLSTMSVDATFHFVSCIVA